MGDHRMNSPITFFKVGKDGRLIAPPGMSKKEAAVHRQSIPAWEHYRETGDESKLRKAGLLPPEDSEQDQRPERPAQPTLRPPPHPATRGA